MSDDGSTTTQKILHGHPAAPGIAIGTVYLQLRGQTVVPYYRLQRNREVQQEIRRFDRAVERLQRNFEALKKSLADAPSQDPALILQAHIELLGDPQIRETTVRTITEQKMNAEAAFHGAIQDVLAVFSTIDDDYLRSRSEDIHQLEQGLLIELEGGRRSGRRGPSAGDVVVVADLSPDEAIELAQVPVAGVVAEQGSAAGHAAIIAGAFGIPMITGIDGATTLLSGGQTVVVDGTQGTVAIDLDASDLRDVKRRQQEQKRRQQRAREESTSAAKTPDGFRVHFLANIELPEETGVALAHGAEGVGLYRTEFLFLNRDKPPSLTEMTRHYTRTVKRMDGREVTFRTFDVGGDKLPRSLAFVAGDNPALGLRGIRYSLENPKVFDRQVEAIVRASRSGPVRLLLPMVTSHDELIEARARIAAITRKEKIRSLPVGIMIETPSSITIADILARDADFFSIGTNDLIQYALAVDRTNSHVNHLYSPLNPAVLRMLRHVTEVARDCGLELSVCGEAAGDPQFFLILLGLGVQRLSMNPRSIPRIHAMVRRTPKAEAVHLLQGLMALHDLADIEGVLQRQIEDRYLDLL